MTIPATEDEQWAEIVEIVEQAAFESGTGLETAQISADRLIEAGFRLRPTPSVDELAKAWDDGYSAGFTDGQAGGSWSDDDNPYRRRRY